MQDRVEDEARGYRRALGSGPLFGVVLLEAALEDDSLGIVEADETWAEERVGGVGGSGEEEEEGYADYYREHSFDFLHQMSGFLLRGEEV